MNMLWLTCFCHWDATCRNWGSAELFDNSLDVADVVKWREIYEQMGSVTGGYQDAANVLEGVILTVAGQQELIWEIPV